MEARIKRRGQKGLRTGYTTGACATAAAKAATFALIYQKRIRSIDINLPAREKAKFRISKLIFNKNHASSSVIKDAGDDPDVTHRAEIVAEVGWLEGSGSMILEGSNGVGIVTKLGLPVPIGRPAINPVPERMIRESVREVMEGGGIDRSIKVIISVPKGKELAKRTLNSRLGILDGISILGTTGIVKPFSLDAYRETIGIGIAVAAASGLKQIVLTPGRSSEKVAEAITALPKEGYIIMGDHAGYALRYAYEKGFRDFVIAGQMGKLSKIADGNFKTHVRDASINKGRMTEWGREAGLKQEDLYAISKGNTTREISEYMKEKGVKRFFNIVTREVISSIKRYIGSDLKVRCLLLSGDGAILADKRQ